jgi:hypothetical protein
MPARLPSLGQLGVQQPDIDMDIMLPIGQPHLPLQPSSMPARLPSAGQVGVQMHVPCAQWPLLPHPLLPQSHVSMQVPLLQTLPSLQITSAHGLLTHLPALQLWPLGHCTPAHGFAVAQVSAHVKPAPQLAVQLFCIAHFPLLWSHTCPDGQVTPAHGCRKQPAIQWPSTQVWLLAQVTPAHGSLVGTQVALQVAPPPQPIIPLALAHGSVWQLPPRQTWPAAQAVAHPPELPPLPVPVPVPVPVEPATPVALPPTPVALPPPPVTLPPVPGVVGCPAPPLGVPVAPALPPLPAGDAPPQPVAARPAARTTTKGTSPRLARIAARPTDRLYAGVLVIAPPDASVAGARGPVR